jgi:60 kDa SS-A/Ro ribonucleoprotein
MANQTLFASLREASIPQTNTVNSENAPAYALAPKQALAQYAATGCFGRTFYATAEGQLARVLELCNSLDAEFVARVAIYSRTQSFMKDMPALLCAWLAAHDARLHEAVFPRVIDNARMLRTYEGRSRRRGASTVLQERFMSVIDRKVKSRLGRQRNAV